MKSQSKPKAFLQSLRRPAVAAAAFGVLMIVGTMLFSARHWFSFISLEGLFIVVGGVIAVAFMSFQAKDVWAALYAIRDMLKEPRVTHDNLHHDMIRILAWARLYKEKGARGLEASIGASGLNDPFVKYGLNMVVSNYKPEEVRIMMETAAESFYERDTVPAHILQSMASHAPAFGMIGTLIGMVAMLYNLGDNVTGIGSGLAVAFLSTFYGVVTARMVYMPAAARILQQQESLRFRNYLITEGMVLLVENKSSAYIQDRLNSFLRPEIHDNVSIEALNRALLPRLRTV